MPSAETRLGKPIRPGGAGRRKLVRGERGASVKGDVYLPVS